MIDRRAISLVGIIVAGTALGTAREGDAAPPQASSGACDSGAAIVDQWHVGKATAPTTTALLRKLADRCAPTSPMTATIARARAASIEGDGAERDRLLDGVLQIEPGNVEALWRRCQSYRAEMNWASARRHCDKALLLAPTDFSTVFQAGRVESDSGEATKSMDQFKKAWGLYDRASRLPSNNIEKVQLAIERARLATRWGSPPDSAFGIAELDRARLIAPQGLNDAHLIPFWRASALRSMGKLPEALATVDAATAEFRTSGLLWTLKAEIHLAHVEEDVRNAFEAEEEHEVFDYRLDDEKIKPADLAHIRLADTAYGMAARHGGIVPKYFSRQVQTIADRTGWGSSDCKDEITIDGDKWFFEMDYDNEFGRRVIYVEIAKTPKTQGYYEIGFHKVNFVYDGKAVIPDQLKVGVSIDQKKFEEKYDPDIKAAATYRRFHNECIISTIASEQTEYQTPACGEQSYKISPGHVGFEWSRGEFFASKDETTVRRALAKSIFETGEFTLLATEAQTPQTPVVVGKFSIEGWKDRVQPRLLAEVRRRDAEKPPKMCI